MTATIPRVIVLWCPDWPITAALSSAGLSKAGSPVALLAKGRVFAASAAARAEGVARGQRQREAQSKCPELTVLDYDPATDNRVFEPIIAALEESTPGVHVLRPGLCAVRSRGAARYYGGERAAALALIARIDERTSGASLARAGVADGIFTAEQAARGGGSSPSRAEASAGGVPRGGAVAGERVRIVEAGRSADFLGPLDVGLLSAGVLGEPGLVTLLRRLGIRTLGEFAALGADDVRTRFGASGARLHALAAGSDSWPVTPRIPPRDLDVEVAFEPALDRVDQVAFGVRAIADEFIAALTAARLVCTAIRVELRSDSGEFSDRVWLHPRSFTAADVVDRVRWQTQASNVVDAGLSSGIIGVRIGPEAVDGISHHEAGLWGEGPAERIHHGLSRVQSMLGHGGVLMPSLAGGRGLTQRQQLVPWGDRPVGGRSPAQPWPGQLPTPLPGTVFATRHPVQVLDAAQAQVSVDDRGVLSGAPAQLIAGSAVLAIVAWAGPWAIDERWWSADALRAHRFQAVDSTGCAWLLALDESGWWAEARYD